MMNEHLVHEHTADLRRDAVAHRRVASRADRAAPRATERVGRWARGVLLHGAGAPVGCGS